MISRDQIQELIDRPANGHKVLSVFLDMSVNSDNKRTYQVFLNKEKAGYAELASDRDGHHREAIGEAFSRLQQWVDTQYDEANKGVAVYMELGGDWLRGHQVPLPMENRLVVDRLPYVSPLVEIVQRYHHHGVILVDREHLRLLSLYLDQTLNEREVTTEPYPAPHDIQRGGFSARDFQARKAEETKHFFKEFAAEVEDFVRVHRPEDLILLGTQENVRKFSEFLPEAVRRKVVHTDRMEIDATPPEIREKLAPILARRVEEREARAIDLLRERVGEGHKAVSGYDDTLEQLQSGKIERLVVARNFQENGGRCDQCGFFLARSSGECPYCGGTIHDGFDLFEETVRIAEDQGVEIEFVEPSAIRDLGCVGGLLRF